MCSVCQSARDLEAACDQLTVACNTKVSLRQYWNSTLKEPVPERLTEVLDKLK